MNSEHRTSNIECLMGKDEARESELVKIFVTSRRLKKKQQMILIKQEMRFDSMLEIRCSRWICFETPVYGINEASNVYQTT